LESELFRISLATPSELSARIRASLTLAALRPVIAAWSRPATKV